MKDLFVYSEIGSAEIRGTRGKYAHMCIGDFCSRSFTCTVKSMIQQSIRRSSELLTLVSQHRSSRRYPVYSKGATSESRGVSVPKLCISHKVI